MSDSTEAPPLTVIPFPANGRPVFWLPRPIHFMLVFFCAAMLLGVPPASPAVSSTGSSPPSDWELPVNGEVLRDFEAPPQPWAAGHRGVDLAASTEGDIRSPADGVVSFSGVVVNREVLSINHGAGYVSSFEPVESELQVGDSVSAGQTIAVLGTYDDDADHCPSACLHWGVRLHGEYLNPLLLTGDLEPSILLPLGSGG